MSGNRMKLKNGALLGAISCIFTANAIQDTHIEALKTIGSAIRNACGDIKKDGDIFVFRENNSHRYASPYEQVQSSIVEPLDSLINELTLEDEDAQFKTVLLSIKDAFKYILHTTESEKIDAFQIKCINHKLKLCMSTIHESIKNIEATYKLNEFDHSTFDKFDNKQNWDESKRQLNEKKKNMPALELKKLETLKSLQLPLEFAKIVFARNNELLKVVGFGALAVGALVVSMAAGNC